MTVVRVQAEDFDPAAELARLEALGPGGVAYYAMLRMPRLIEQAAPLAVLAGSLFAFAKLAGESAVTAMRSTGIARR